MTGSSNAELRISSSYRDPSGFVFRSSEGFFRQINFSYQETFEQFIRSGLYKELSEAKLLVMHSEVINNSSSTAYKIIQPEEIPFISYPYEWSFSQLKDAALLTLEIQRRALEKGFTLKDASAFNVQFLHGKPVFIDTLSFDLHQEGSPWAAYRQFCEHFLMPLALASYTDLHSLLMQRNFLDGIPLSLGVTLLPLKARMKFGLMTHLFIHSSFQKKYESSVVSKKIKRKITLFQTRALIDSLMSVIKKLSVPSKLTTWGEYYQDTNYSKKAMQQKKDIIAGMIQKVNPITVLDLGANTGVFSELAAGQANSVISVDFDPLCIERNYLRLKESGTQNILPLTIDLTNPTPALGWELRERTSFTERFSGELTLALALVHHLAIGRNLPFDYIARFTAELSKNLIIEFVPKSDSQVQKLLANREDIFPEYNEDGFLKCFQKYYTVIERSPVSDSQRVLFLMQRK